MRGLIIRQPWADRIVDGSKTWELRSRRTKISERIGIIAAGTCTVIGEADLVDCFAVTQQTLLDSARLAGMDRQLAAHVWSQGWRYVWRLANAERYNHAAPYRHPSGAVTWVRLDGLIGRHSEKAMTIEIDLIDAQDINKHQGPAWYTVRHLKAHSTHTVVRLICGGDDCRESAIGIANHSVTPNGHVSPSLKCPACGWHINGYLKEWPSTWQKFASSPYVHKTT